MSRRQQGPARGAGAMQQPADGTGPFSMVRWATGAVMLASAACAGQSGTTRASEQNQAVEAAHVSPVVAEEPNAAPAAASDPITVTGVGLSTPESVLHVPELDVYLVSNINGGPADKDDNGFVTRLGMQGEVLSLKWIDGASDNVTLNAPKGMAVVDGTLYVADIDVVRMFDLRTGEPRGEVSPGGARFLNDVAASRQGRVYVSDTGSLEEVSGEAGDAVYVLEGGQARALIRGRELGGPNGLQADEQGVWVVSTRSGELYRVSAEGKREFNVKLPQGGLDGVVDAGDGQLLVSSWAAGAILQGRPDGAFKQVLNGVQGPADIGYDAGRRRLLIPLFMENAVRIQPL